jgi:hypothetical protein
MQVPSQAKPGQGGAGHGDHSSTTGGLNQAINLRTLTQACTKCWDPKGAIRDPGGVPVGTNPSTGQQDMLYGLHANEDGSLMHASSPPGSQWKYRCIW